ncbi:MAG: transglutaminase family protein [Alphaproteobacteria bacterium]|nr:transglutaminase family protein [Alphaproteobacteria bacterium]MCY4320201.1 transglutaminase family protein [Alphaproteobacteria bacterium]
MHLSIRHDTVYRYDPPPAQLTLRLRLFAVDNPMQRIKAWTVTVNGAEMTPLLINSFGDREALWRAPAPPEQVQVSVEGAVETENRAGMLGRWPPHRPAVFLRYSPLTKPSDGVASFARKAASEQNGPLPLLHQLNEAAAEALEYRPGATDSHATAAEALARGAGVCQDRAHLFVAACRFLEIPARYVVGYLYDPAAPLGETHAWAEAWVEGLGWVGFDPTHRQSPTDAYIRLSSGLDAFDATPIRGHIHGESMESLTADVAVGVMQ